MPRHSKIQLQVLSLYKQFLRTARDKPGMQEYVRNEFKSNMTIPRTDTMRIEYVLRRATRQLEQMRNSNVIAVNIFKRTEISSNNL